jgi:hypothetical protein
MYAVGVKDSRVCFLSALSMSACFIATLTACPQSMQKFNYSWYSSFLCKLADSLLLLSECPDCGNALQFFFFFLHTPSLPITKTTNARGAKLIKRSGLRKCTRHIIISPSGRDPMNVQRAKLVIFTARALN